MSNYMVAINSMTGMFSKIRPTLRLLLVLCCTTTPTSLYALTVADSVADFSSTQGSGGWSYGYIDPASGPSMVPFPLFVPVPLWPGGDLPFWSIDNPTPGGTHYFTAVWAWGGHTNGLVTSGFKPREHWPVRRWISDVSGSVSITGMFGDYNGFSVNQDGVIGEVLVDGVLVWTQNTNGSTPDAPYSLNLPLNLGSVVDFQVKPKVSDYTDQFTFTATITADQIVAIPEPTTATASFIAIAGLSWISLKRYRSGRTRG